MLPTILAIAVAIGTILSAVGTFVLAFLTRRVVQANEAMAKANRAMVAINQDMVTEMRETRLAPTRPLILLEFELNDNTLWIQVCNYGGLAANVRFTFEPPLINSQGENIGESQQFAVPWPYLPPDRPRRIPFGPFLGEGGYGLAYYIGSRPASFTVTVQSRDPATGTEYPAATVVLDLRWLAPSDPAPAFQPLDQETESIRASRFSPEKSDLT